MKTVTTDSSILQSLKNAVSSCDHELNEEQGGFIVKKAEADEFEFVKVHNQNSGTPRAVSLYTADRVEFGKKVLSKTLDDSWSEFASFHTHPKGFGPYPSHTDLTELFLGFGTNFIYSPDQQKLMSYTFDKQNNVWQAQQVHLK